MTNYSFLQNLTSTVLGNGTAGKLEVWEHQTLNNLQHLVTAVRDNFEDVKARCGDSGMSPDEIVEAAALEMNGLAAAVTTSLPQAVAEENSARRFQAAFQITHTIARQPIRADTQKNLLLFGGLTLIEGLATSLFFLSGGFVSGITEALGLGLTISAVNIVVSGFIGGGFFGKFWAYGLQARTNEPLIGQKRLAGRVCSILTAGAIGFLLLVSGIVRATGNTEGLSFTLDTIGTTASDFHSIMLWVIGLSFSILAWRKGLTAFSDPYPGLTQVSKAVMEAEDKLHAVHEGTLADIEDIHADAMDALADMAEEAAESQQDFIDDLQDLRHEHRAVLAAISDAEHDYCAYRAELLEFHQIVHGGKGMDQSTDDPDIAFDLTELKNHIPVIAIDVTACSNGFAETHKQALTRLTEARKSAVKLVNEAYQAAQA